MKKRILIVAAMTTLLASCEQLNDNYIKHNTDRVYLSPAGYMMNDIYDLGKELKWADTIYISKNGTQTATEATLQYDAGAIDTYTASNETDYTLKALPENAARLSTTHLFFGNSVTEPVMTVCTFDMDVVKQTLAKETDARVRYVYPVSLALPVGSKAGRTADKAYILAGINLLSPEAYLTGRGSVTSKTLDFFRGGTTGSVSFPLQITIPFTNEGDPLTFTCKVQADSVARYNSENGTAYELLPAEAYTISALTLAKGEDKAQATVKVNTDKLPKDVGGHDYLLPVEITGSSNPDIPVEKNAICYLNLKQIAKFTGNWTVNILEESNLGSNNNTSGSVVLYSYKDAMKYQKNFDSNFNSNLAALTANTAYDKIRDELIFGPGWAAYYYDQAAQVFRVTDEDYDATGKKKVEIVSGYICGFLYPERIKTWDNKSWYDPSSNQIHLEYKGYVYWGGTDTYSVNRTFINQQLSDTY